MGDIILNAKPMLEMQKIDKACDKYKMNKDDLLKDGISIETVDMPMDTFLKLSGGDDKITKADVLAFVDKQGVRDDTAAKLTVLLNEHTNSLTAIKIGSNEIYPKFSVNWTDKGDLKISCVDRAFNSPMDPEYVLMAAIKSQDTDGDKKIDIFKELKSNQEIASTKDALDAAGTDKKISMPELILKLIKNQSEGSYMDMKKRLDNLGINVE